MLQEQLNLLIYILYSNLSLHLHWTTKTTHMPTWMVLVLQVRNPRMAL